MIAAKSTMYIIDNVVIGDINTTISAHTHSIILKGGNICIKKRETISKIRDLSRTTSGAMPINKSKI